MRYLVLACDYDGTLATHGRLDPPTLAALGRLRNSGRRLVLVTGRELEELLDIFPQVTLFERVVAENGALLYNPATKEERLLGERPPEAFIQSLRERGVAPLSVGRVIVATWHPHETEVIQAIHDLGLELQVIFNKDAVMVLPSGVNKATGLRVALDELGLSPHNAVGVGDAENDHAFLALCECSVAVDNALPMLKERADWVTRKDHGAGVVELIDHLLRDDLRDLAPRLGRHDLLLGHRDEDREVRLPPFGASVLLTGTSGSGKSTLATAILERLAEHGYQFCILDPEGDYADLPGAVVFGDPHNAPRVEEALKLLERPEANAVVNMVGIALDDRPKFFEGLLPRLQELRARTGRPHWIVVDETHHMLPDSWDPVTLTLPQDLGGTLFITVHPDRIAPAVLASIDLLLTVGASPEETVRSFCAALKRPAPEVPSGDLEAGEALAWWSRSGDPPFRFTSLPPRAERRRHRRKYAEGDLGPLRSFCFRGPEGKLNLKAQNLMTFLRMAEGVDDATWLHHFRRGDYSQWFREGIKDEELAAEAAQIEEQRDLSPAEGRARIKAAIEQRYTAPT